MRFLSCALVLFILSCASSSYLPPRPEANSFCTDLEKFFEQRLTAYQDGVDEAGRLYQDEQWKIETAATNADPERMAARFAEYQKTAYNTSVLDEVRAWSKAARDYNGDCPWTSKFKRTHQILESAILTNSAVAAKEKENQAKQDSLVKENNGFRLVLNDEPEPISKALYQKKLGSTRDRALRQRWYEQFNGSRATKWTEWNFQGLLRSRNEEGRLAGFKNYYEYRFFRNQLDLVNYRNLVHEIRTKLAPKVHKILAEWARQDGYPSAQGWDVRYLREKNSSGNLNQFFSSWPEARGMEAAQFFYQQIGLNVTKYDFTTDLYPRPGKNTHAFAMALVFPKVNKSGELQNIPKPDIRFLANLKKPLKWDDVSTLIHELGHAVHAAEVRQPTALFRNIGSVETEALAMTLERLAKSSTFVKSVASEGLAAKDQARLEKELRRYIRSSKIEQAFILLRQVFFSDFEYELYQNPAVDPGQLWSRLHKTYWGISVKPNEADWDVDHFLMSPVYVQNYALGILMVEQLYSSIRDEFGDKLTPSLGEKISKTLMAPGLEFDYLALTEKFTHSPLSAKAALSLLP